MLKSKPTFWLRINDREAHKKDALREGLLKLGYTERANCSADESSVLVTWNLHGVEEFAIQLRQAGGKVLVAENPYIKHDPYGNEYLALQRDGHNGSGMTPEGGTERLEKLGLEFKEWKDGAHVLVADQRGIGALAMRSPPDWGSRIRAQLQRKTGRQIIVRPHPGRAEPHQIVPLSQQLLSCHALVVWASNCATEALLNGVPVFYNAPFITLALAAKKGIDEIENPWKGDRVPAFTKLSWSQWHLKEIASGDALKRLLECTYTPPVTTSHGQSAPPSEKESD